MTNGTRLLTDGVKEDHALLLEYWIGQNTVPKKIFSSYLKWVFLFNFCIVISCLSAYICHAETSLTMASLNFTSTKFSFFDTSVCRRFKTLLNFALLFTHGSSFCNIMLRLCHKINIILHDFFLFIISDSHTETSLVEEECVLGRRPTKSKLFVTRHLFEL